MKILHYLLVLLLLLPSMAMADFFWVAVLDKESGMTKQKMIPKTKLYQLRPDVKKAWKEGYVIIDLSHSPRRWTAVLSKGTGVSKQFYVHRRLMSEFEEVVKYYHHKGYDLRNVENGVGEWLAVFEHGGAVEGTELVVVLDEKQHKTEIKKQQFGVLR